MSAVQLGTATLVDSLRAPDRRDAIALIEGHDDEAITYGELVRRIERRADELGLTTRSVVVLTGENSLDWIVTHLALLSRGHVPLLAGDGGDRLIDRWAPAAVVTVHGDGAQIQRREAGHVELHPDLAVLMSTSGSTGSPKLIRLSHRNLVANARSIAEFQALRPADRGITNLPLHYSLGLSVLHSHLLVGASVVVTRASVVDPCFARALTHHGVTNIAGVPHTYELLDRAGPDLVRAPSLRFLAQAGGRLAPELVAAWAERAESWGIEWFTMYGQTEATARISYVPPALARRHPGSIGRAIPGGELSVVPVDDADAADGAGELVYRGDNVMMGYALDRADLAEGSQLTELHTGDLARFDAESGLFEIVGRRARRIKPYGLRIDLDDVERRFAEHGVTTHVVGDDEVVVAAADLAPAETTSMLAEITGLPPQRCVAVAGEPPRRGSGKVDGAALLAIGHRALWERRSSSEAGTVRADGDGSVDRVAAEFAAVLGVGSVRPDDTFVSLGGDSLSYIECSVRLEQMLGPLPADWHLQPISQLAAPAQPRRLARVDTTVLLRAVGILAVVSTHMRFWHVPGGAHLMLGVVGYNVARFLLPIRATGEFVRAGARNVARIAVPTLVWTAAFMALGQYTWHTLSLVNNYVGPRSHAGNHWHFWFIEVLVHLTLITTALMAVPQLRRADQRWPYAFPLVLLGLAVSLRLDWADMGDWYNLRFRTHAVAWFFVLGWLVYRSSTVPKKLLTTVLCLVTAPGVFLNPQREFFIAFGLVLLVWARELPMPRVAVRPLATLAAASMWIFISHFMIWPPMKQLFIVEVAYPLTVLASLVVWRLAEPVTRRATAWVADAHRHGRLRPPFTVSRPPSAAARSA